MSDKPTPFFDYLDQFEEGRLLLNRYYKYQGQPCLDLNTAIQAISSIRLQSDVQDPRLGGSGMDADYIEGILRFSFHGLPISMDAYHDYRDLLNAAERHVNRCVLAGRSTDFREVILMMDEALKAAFDESKCDVRSAMKDPKTDPMVREALTLWIAERLRPLHNICISDDKTFIKTVPYGTTTGREKHVGPNITQLPKSIRQDLIGRESGKHVVTVDIIAAEIAILMALAGNKDGFAVYTEGKVDLYRHIRSLSKALQNFSRNTVKRLVISYVYGMRVASMSEEFGISRLRCEKIVSALNRIFRLENAYLDKRETQTRRDGYTHEYGCYMKVVNDTPSTTVRNFFVQALGAHLLRQINNAVNSSSVAAEILFNLHDSITFTVNIGEDDAVRRVQALIASTSERILGPGYRLRSKVEHFVHGGGL